MTFGSIEVREVRRVPVPAPTQHPEKVDRRACFSRPGDESLHDVASIPDDWERMDQTAAEDFQETANLPWNFVQKRVRT
jgi:hypothetical protein